MKSYKCPNIIVFSATAYIRANKNININIEIENIKVHVILSWTVLKDDYYATAKISAQCRSFIT